MVVHWVHQKEPTGVKYRSGVYYVDTDFEQKFLEKIH